MDYAQLLAAYRAAGGILPGEQGEGNVYRSQPVTLPDGRIIMVNDQGQIVEYSNTRPGSRAEGGGSDYRVFDQAGGVSDPTFQMNGNPNQWRNSLAGALGIFALPFAAQAAGLAGSSGGAGAGAGAAGAGGVGSELTGTIMAAEGAGAAGGAGAAIAPAAATVPAAAIAPAAAAGAGGLWGLGPTGTAILAGTAIGGLASMRAGSAQADAARSAADSTLAATRESNDLLRTELDRSRTDAEPWRAAGATSLAELMRQLGIQGDASSAGYGSLNDRFTGSDLQSDPGYAFRLAEGEKAINRAASAAGRFDSGRALKELTRYGQDYASGEFSNAANRFVADRDSRFNRLSSLAGLGSQVTTNLGQQGVSGAGQIGANTIGGARAAGDMTTGAAAARASGYVGATNALTGGLGQAINLGQSNRLMDLLTARAGR